MSLKRAFAEVQDEKVQAEADRDIQRLRLQTLMSKATESSDESFKAAALQVSITQFNLFNVTLVIIELFRHSLCAVDATAHTGVQGWALVKLILQSLFQFNSNTTSPDHVLQSLIVKGVFIAGVGK